MIFSSQKIEGMVFGDSEQSGVEEVMNSFMDPLDLFMSSPQRWEIINTPNSLVFSSHLERLSFK